MTSPATTIPSSRERLRVKIAGCVDTLAAVLKSPHQDVTLTWAICQSLAVEEKMLATLIGQHQALLVEVKRPPARRKGTMR